MNRFGLWLVAVLGGLWPVLTVPAQPNDPPANEPQLYDGRKASDWADIYRVNAASREQAFRVLQNIPWAELEPSCHKFMTLVIDKDPKQQEIGRNYIKLCKRGALKHIQYALEKWTPYVPWKLELAKLYGELGVEGLYDLGVPDRLLKDSTLEVRKAALTALIAVIPTDPKLIPTDAPKDYPDQIRKVLTLTFTDKENWEVRAAALQIIGTLKLPVRDVLPELERSLKHKEWPVRNAAAKAIENLGPAARTALPALTKLVEDPNEATPVAKTALAAIAAMGAKDALPFLMKTATSAGYFDLRIESVRLLGTQGEPAKVALALIGNYLRDPDWKMRVAAAQALAGLGPVALSQTPQVVQALSDPAWHVRVAALETIVAIGDKAYPQAVPAIANLLQDKEWVVRGAAADALGKCGPAAKSVTASLLTIIRDVKEFQGTRDKASSAFKLIDPQGAAQAGVP